MWRSPPDGRPTTGTTWHGVDPETLAAAGDLAVEPESAGRVDLKREPRLHVGGDGSSGDNNNGAAFPTIPFGGAVFGPQPGTAPDFSRPFVGNFFTAIGPFLVRGLISNITGFVTAASPPLDAVDQERPRPNGLPTPRCAIRWYAGCPTVPAIR